MKSAAKKSPAKKSPAKKAAPLGDVDALLRALDHPLKKEIETVRRTILGAAPGVSEAVKWNAPSFRTEKEFFATVNLRSKEEVQVVFHLGAKARPDLRAFEVADPNRLMKWLGKDRAMVSLGAGRTLAANHEALVTIVRAWIEHV